MHPVWLAKALRRQENPDMRRSFLGNLLLFGTAAFATAVAGVARSTAQVEIEVNRPRTPFDCDTPLGEKWYGSEERCLEELCGGKNVTNEYIFEANGRSRRNPCYGRNPTQFEER